MAVYVDNSYVPATVVDGRTRHTSRWCHLTADTHGKLMAFADRLGLRREWVQLPGTWKEHFDLTLRKRALAVQLGAVEVSAAERMRAMIAARDAPPPDCPPR